jgi:hypothetical protein
VRRIAFRIRHRGDHLTAEVLRVRAREPDAIDAVDRVAGAQELAEFCLDVGEEVSAPRVDVLTEERDLTDALVRQLRYLGQDLAGAPADLAPAHGRNDAVRTDGVAAHRDLHPGLKAPFAMHRQRAGELALRPGAEAAARSLPARAEPFREVRDRPRPERDVDERVQIEEPLPLRLGVAAADGDHLFRVRELHDLRVAEMRCKALVRLLADRAGVEDEDICLLL